MTTPLFLLRAVELGLSVSDLSLLTIGLVNDMFTEKNNDEYKYKEVAMQEDFDKFRCYNICISIIGYNLINPCTI